MSIPAASAGPPTTGETDSGLVRPLARFKGDAVQRHEWPVFKANWRKGHEGEPRLKMPIIVAHPAYVDNQYWVLEKIRDQAIVITREKTT